MAEESVGDMILVDNLSPINVDARVEIMLRKESEGALPETSETKEVCSVTSGNSEPLLSPKSAQAVFWWLVFDNLFIVCYTNAKSQLKTTPFGRL